MQRVPLSFSENKLLVPIAYLITNDHAYTFVRVDKEIGTATRFPSALFINKA
jgi:hypothetical protein